MQFVFNYHKYSQAFPVTLGEMSTTMRPFFSDDWLMPLFTITRIVLQSDTPLETCHCMLFSSVAQSCPTLCYPMDCSTPGFPVHYQLPELTQTYSSIESVMPSNNLILCVPFSSCLQSFLALRSFLMSQLFTSGGQSIGVSASTSDLPMNTQD